MSDLHASLQKQALKSGSAAQDVRVLSSNGNKHSLETASNQELPSQPWERLVSENAGTASERAIVLNLITCSLGSSIFSLPWALAGSSVFSGMLITALVLVVNGWTLCIIVRAADKYNAFDLGAIISNLPGGLGMPLQVFTNVCVWFSMFFCLVSYTIVIHDTAYKYLEMVGITSRFLIVTLASVFVFPLCFLNQAWLEKTSSIAVLLNVYLFITVGVLYFQKGSDNDLPEGCCLVGSTIKGNFAMISNMFQAVIVQMIILPMYEELENRSPQKFDRIVVVSFVALFVIFGAFCVFSYLLIGPNVHDDVLSPGQLPDNIWTDIGKIGTIFIVAFVYPIVVYPMIAPLHSIKGRVNESMRPLFITAAKAIIVVAALLVAFCRESLGEINIINGALSVGVFVALIPSAIGFLLLDPNPCYKVALVMLLVVGLVVSGLGFAFTDNYVSDLKCSVFAKR